MCVTTRHLIWVSGWKIGSEAVEENLSLMCQRTVLSVFPAFLECICWCCMCGKSMKLKPENEGTTCWERRNMITSSLTCPARVHTHPFYVICPRSLSPKDESDSELSLKWNNCTYSTCCLFSAHLHCISCVSWVLRVVWKKEIFNAVMEVEMSMRLIRQMNAV